MHAACIACRESYSTSIFPSDFRDIQLIKSTQYIAPHTCSVPLSTPPSHKKPNTSTHLNIKTNSTVFLGK
jgi:hypothetical protein